jgi:hypothetical protein
MSFKPGRAFTASLLSLLLALAAGCGRTSPPPAVVQSAEAAVAVSTEPLEVELYDPKVTWRDEDVVMMEVKYRCAKGEPKPSSHYRLELRFAGHPNDSRIMTLFGPALRKEGGTFKDGFSLPKDAGKMYEIVLAEGDVPWGPFHKMSNVVKGEIKK